jgi:hypothetical protein
MEGATGCKPIQAWSFLGIFLHGRFWMETR